MKKHKYDAAASAAKKAAKEKLVADTEKKSTVKDLAERVAGLEVAVGIK